jgi:hypothetical protein
MANNKKTIKGKGGGKTSEKARGTKQARKLTDGLQSVKVHPRLAKAILSLKKLAPEELERVRSLSATATATSAPSTGCWISDSGGQQHCINLPPDVCTREKGMSVPTRCPNA